MNQIISQQSFDDLKNIKKSQDVERFISQLDVANSTDNPSGHQYKWYPIGGSFSNAANIALASNTMAPIVERITNAYDANIEKRQSFVSVDIPASPRKAVEKWFDIPQGDTGRYSTTINNEARSDLASLSKVELYGSGDDKKPTVIIRDSGVGQHPSDFKKTLLKLGESNKISCPYLHGVYGHGGSSTYRFCEYSIIISRRQIQSLGGKDDIIGWTIIRKDNAFQIYSERDGRVIEIKQPPVYEYLCLENGDVPYYIPEENCPFEYGTLIIHVAYDARTWYNLSRGLGYRLFRSYLFDPVLPFRLEDMRPNFESFNRNMFGARATLLTSNDVAYHNEAKEYLPDGGLLLIRYWVLFDETDPIKRPLVNYLERENSRNTIILTLNGQRHAALERNVISKELRFSNLSHALLVQVEIDSLSRQMKAELFTSNRETIVSEGDAIELIRKKLIESLGEDEELKQWERKLMIQISRATDDESKKAVKKMLNQLIKVGIMPGTGGSREVEVEGGTGTSVEYKPQDPPTSMRFLTKQDPIEIVQGKIKKIHLEINGPDNLFTRRNHKANLSFNLQQNCGVTVSFNRRELKNGKLPIILLASHDAEILNAKKLSFRLDCDLLSSPLETESSVVVISPPIFTPQEPPTDIHFLRIPPIKLYKGKSNSIGIAMNGNDDIFDRQTDKAIFTLDCPYNHATLIRTRKPKNGKMQVSVFVDNNAKIGDTFNITCKLQLMNGSFLSDTKEAVITEETERDDKEGGMTTVSLPNYDIEPVYKEDWGQFGWDETSVGRYCLTRDEDDRDKLKLYVNADNENIVSEINRRIRIGQQRTSENLKNKYIAYIGYHLYLVYEAENERKNGEAVEEEAQRELSEAEKDMEYQRVSRTLVLSFQAISQLPEDED